MNREYIATLLQHKVLQKLSMSKVEKRNYSLSSSTADKACSYLLIHYTANTVVEYKINEALM